MELEEEKNEGGRGGWEEEKTGGEPLEKLPRKKIDKKICNSLAIA